MNPLSLNRSSRDTRRSVSIVPADPQAKRDSVAEKNAKKPSTLLPQPFSPIVIYAPTRRELRLLERFYYDGNARESVEPGKRNRKRYSYKWQRDTGSVSMESVTPQSCGFQLYVRLEALPSDEWNELDAVAQMNYEVLRSDPSLAVATRDFRTERDDDGIPLDAPPHNSFSPSSFVSSARAYRNILAAISFCLYGNAATHVNRLVRLCRARFVSEHMKDSKRNSSANETRASTTILGRSFEESNNQNNLEKEHKRLQQKTKLLLRKLLVFLQDECGVSVVVISRVHSDVLVLLAESSKSESIDQKEDVQMLINETAYPLVVLELVCDSNGPLWIPLLVRDNTNTRRTNTSTSAAKRPRVQNKEDPHAPTSSASSPSPPNATGKPGADAIEVGPAGRVVCDGDPAIVFGAEEECMEVRSSDEEPLKEDPTAAPFYGMMYPNIEQTDIQFMLVTKAGLHRTFSMNKLRLLSTLALSFFTLVLSIFLVCWMSRTSETCCAYSNTTECYADDISSDSESSVNSASDIQAALNAFCSSAYNPLMRKAHLVTLFTETVSIGRCLIVIAACSFSSIVATLLVSFFTIRALAQERARPTFYAFMYVAHILLAAVACAFACYSMYLLRTPKSKERVRCADLSGRERSTCYNLEDLVLDLFADASLPDDTLVALVYPRPTAAAAPFGIAIALTVVAALHFLMSLLQPMPAAAVRQSLPHAVPDTYFFRPNEFAPDGPTQTQLECLQQVVREKLYDEVEHAIQNRDLLVTRLATIGDMMEDTRRRSIHMLAQMQQDSAGLDDMNNNSNENVAHYMVDRSRHAFAHAPPSALHLSHECAAEIERIGERVTEALRRGHTAPQPTQTTSIDRAMESRSLLTDRVPQRLTAPRGATTTTTTTTRSALDAEIHSGTSESEARTREEIDSIARRVLVEAMLENVSEVHA